MFKPEDMVNIPVCSGASAFRMHLCTLQSRLSAFNTITSLHPTPPPPPTQPPLLPSPTETKPVNLSVLQNLQQLPRLSIAEPTV